MIHESELRDNYDKLSIASEDYQRQLNRRISELEAENAVLRAQKVFVLARYSLLLQRSLRFSRRQIMGIFSSKKLAESALQEAKKNRPSARFEILEYTLDAE